MSQTKNSQAGKNLIIRGQVEFGKWHLSWDGKIAKHFYRDYTVKRPKFDTLFGENIFFLLIFFSWPPLKIFGGVS